MRVRAAKRQQRKKSAARAMSGETSARMPTAGIHCMRRGATQGYHESGTLAQKMGGPIEMTATIPQRFATVSASHRSHCVRVVAGREADALVTVHFPTAPTRGTEVSSDIRPMSRLLCMKMPRWTKPTLGKTQDTEMILCGVADLLQPFEAIGGLVRIRLASAMSACGRLCCKSRQADSVKLKFETIESGGRFFWIVVACSRLILNQCFPPRCSKTFATKSAQSVRNWCPLSCPQWGLKRTRFAHCEFFRILTHSRPRLAIGRQQFYISPLRPGFTVGIHFHQGLQLAHLYLCQGRSQGDREGDDRISRYERLCGIGRCKTRRYLDTDNCNFFVYQSFNPDQINIRLPCNVEAFL